MDFEEVLATSLC